MRFFVVLTWFTISTAGFSNGEYPLVDWFEAAAFGNHNDVVAALDAGADPNAHDAFGVSVLMVAARHNPNAGGNDGVISALIAAGADVNFRSSLGHTAVDYATETDSLVQLRRSGGERGTTLNLLVYAPCSEALLNAGVCQELKAPDQFFVNLENDRRNPSGGESGESWSTGDPLPSRGRSPIGTSSTSSRSSSINVGSDTYRCTSTAGNNSSSLTCTTNGRVTTRTTCRLIGNEVVCTTSNY